ncbi:uncharacterized protein LOC123219759 [Mangifera indica]|uniref:uncharacterized protein LOC123219759 n=1 Tax=Mangifera indica TaxID=29780 RepID=UPI001CFBCB4F|nr:uncharacterized protein LOC123219759 [Mangifera indica]
MTMLHVMLQNTLSTDSNLMFILDLPPMQSKEIMKDHSTSESASTENKLEILIAPPYEKPAGTFAHAKSAISDSDHSTEIETRNRHFRLHWAALEGDWDTAEIIFKESDNDITAKLSNEGDTALHIAAEASSTTFVKKLVEKMKIEDLEIKNNAGNTAFFLAAASNRVAIVKAMMEKKEDLINNKGDNDMLPLVVAALKGNKEMTELLYEATGEELLDDSDRIELLVSLINHGLYDIALDLVERHPKMAIARDKNQLTALHHLAKMPVLRPTSHFDWIKSAMRFLILLCNGVKRVVIKGHNSALRRQFVQDINKLGFRDRINERELQYRVRMGFDYWIEEAKFEILYVGEKTPHTAFELIKCVWKQVLLLDESRISEIIRKPWALMFEAAKRGNDELLHIIWETYPDMMLEVDENHHSIFHVAVMYRQDRIFRFIHKIGPLKKDLIVQKTDTQGNNILHLAAKLPPEDRSINESAVPVYRMTLEQLWFKAVKKILGPVDPEAPNNDGKTARALFTEQHKELSKKADKWIKETANACIVVVTLIITMAVAAGLTVPGGTKEETGTPNFVQRASFIIFILSIAAALFFSSLSLEKLISVFSHPYEETGFDSGLEDLMKGLGLLLISIVFVTVGFCANVFIVFKDGMPWIPIFTMAMGSFAVIILWNHSYISRRKNVGLTREYLRRDIHASLNI